MSGETVELVGCVIADDQHRVLLLHRTDHNQWQLPGGRIRPVDRNEPTVLETAEAAARREAVEELGLKVVSLARIGQDEFRQGPTRYSCEWFRILESEGFPFPQQPGIYDDFDFHNLLRHDIGRLVLSPNVVRLVDAIERGAVLL